MRVATSSLFSQLLSCLDRHFFARAVREDPIREGLLFLATEHGVYFSIDDGAQWQSLQLNLPDTPIRDLVIKDDDVVLGSHGRGFWILDDIRPLRQYSEEMKDKAAVLFTPANAIRGISDATVQYYLKEALDTITVEILDAQDRVVNTYTGSQPAYEEDPDLPWWQRGGSSKPTTAQGLNAFTWDLRYPGATTFEGMIIWSARPQRGPKAPPGAYKVRIKTAYGTETRPFSIVMDPNLKGISQADLEAQFELSNQIMGKTSTANQTVIDIRKMKSHLEENRDQIPAGAFQKTVQPFMDQLSAVEEELYQVKNQSNQDPLNFPIKLNNRLASLRRSVETGDARPTDGAYKVYNELSAELDAHLNTLNTVLKKELPKVNKVLGNNGIDPIESQ